MREDQSGVLEQLARQAVELGADTLEVEYRDGHDEVVAYMGSLGREIERFRSNTPEDSALRGDLYATKRRRLRFSAAGHEYAIRAEVYENFGEDAFRVELRPSNDRMRRTRSAPARNRGPGR